MIPSAFAVLIHRWRKLKGSQRNITVSKAQRKSITELTQRMNLKDEKRNTDQQRLTEGVIDYWWIKPDQDTKTSKKKKASPPCEIGYQYLKKQTKGIDY